MHAPLNGVNTTPVIPILAIPLRRIHPTIIPRQLVAVCCVICRLFHEVPPISCHTLHSCIILPPILQSDHFSAFSLVHADSQSYPMHMRLNGASKTLIRLIEGVFPNSA